MKKVLAMILSAALAAALLAGCGQGGAPAPAGSGQPEAPAAGKTLNVWLPPLSANQDDKEVWDKIMDPFEEEHGVTVNVEIVPWGNYEEKYLTGITSGQGPDVGYMYMEMITDFIDMGAVEPLDEYLTDADKDNLLYLANGVIRGKQYCLSLIHI